MGAVPACSADSGWGRVTLTTGVNLLGKVVRISESGEGIPDWEDEGRFWRTTGPRAKSLEPGRQEFLWREPEFGNLLGTVIVLRHDAEEVSMDTDLRGKRMHWKLLTSDRRVLSETTKASVEAAVDLTELLGGVLGGRASIEGSAGAKVGPGSGRLYLEFIIPCLRLGVDVLNPPVPTVHEVILGASVRGTIESTGERTTTTEGKVGMKAKVAESLPISAEVSGQNAVELTLGDFNLALTAHGGPEIEFAQQCRTMGEIIKYFQSEWQQHVFSRPQTWQVVFANVAGPGGTGPPPLPKPNVAAWTGQGGPSATSDRPAQAIVPAAVDAEVARVTVEDPEVRKELENASQSVLEAVASRTVEAVRAQLQSPAAQVLLVCVRAGTMTYGLDWCWESLVRMVKEDEGIAGMADRVQEAKMDMYTLERRVKESKESTACDFFTIAAAPQTDEQTEKRVQEMVQEHGNVSQTYSAGDGSSIFEQWATDFSTEPWEKLAEAKDDGLVSAQLGRSRAEDQNVAQRLARSLHYKGCPNPTKETTVAFVGLPKVGKTCLVRSLRYLIRNKGLAEPPFQEGSLEDEGARNCFNVHREGAFVFLDFPSFSEHFIDTFDFVFKTGVVPGATYKEMDPDTGSLAKRMAQGDHSGVLKVDVVVLVVKGTKEPEIEEQQQLLELIHKNKLPFNVVITHKNSTSKLLSQMRRKENLTPHVATRLAGLSNREEFRKAATAIFTSNLVHMVENVTKVQSRLEDASRFELLKALQDWKIVGDGFFKDGAFVHVGDLTREQRDQLLKQWTGIPSQLPFVGGCNILEEYLEAAAMDSIKNEVIEIKREAGQGLDFTVDAELVVQKVGALAQNDGVCVGWRVISVQYCVVQHSLLKYRKRVAEVFEERPASVRFEFQAQVKRALMIRDLRALGFTFVEAEFPGRPGVISLWAGVMQKKVSVEGCQGQGRTDKVELQVKNLTDKPLKLVVEAGTVLETNPVETCPDAAQQAEGSAAIVADPAETGNAEDMEGDVVGPGSEKQPPRFSASQNLVVAEEMDVELPAIKGATVKAVLATRCMDVDKDIPKRTDSFKLTPFLLQCGAHSGRLGSQGSIWAHRRFLKERAAGAFVAAQSQRVGA